MPVFPSLAGHLRVARAATVQAHPVRNIRQLAGQWGSAIAPCSADGGTRDVRSVLPGVPASLVKWVFLGPRALGSVGRPTVQWSRLVLPLPGRARCPRSSVGGQTSDPGAPAAGVRRGACRREEAQCGRSEGVEAGRWPPAAHLSAARREKCPRTGRVKGEQRGAKRAEIGLRLPDQPCPLRGARLLPEGRRRRYTLTRENELEIKTESEKFIQRLYQENRACLLRYVIKVGRVDPATAEDIVQETFIRAWKNVAKLDRETGELKPWLFAVARNLIIDMARAKKARPQETDDPPHRLPVVPDRTDEVLAELDIASTLAELSAPHREVVVLLHCLDRSIPDAARSIGVPAGTVKSRNYYALKELRRVAGLGVLS